MRQTLMDVRTRGDIKSVAVDSTRQFELLSVDPKNQFACMAGPLGLSCVDHRVGAQVSRVQALAHSRTRQCTTSC
jgi:hypothetical protein